MPIGDNNLEYQLKFKSDTKPVEQSAEALKKLNREAENLNRTASTAAGGLGGLGSTLSMVGTRFAGVTVAVLGLRKVLQAVGKGEGFSEFKENLNSAATALGTIIGRSAPFKATLGALGESMKRFAESVQPEKLNQWVAKMDDGKEAADGWAAGLDAVTAALKTEGDELERSLKLIDERAAASKTLLESQRDLAVAKARPGTEKDVEAEFAGRFQSLDQRTAAQKAALLRERADFIDQGGNIGFPDAINETDARERLREIARLAPELAANTQGAREAQARAAKLREGGNPLLADLAEQTVGTLLSARRGNRARLDELRAGLPPGVTTEAQLDAALAQESGSRAAAFTQAATLRDRAAGFDRGIAHNLPVFENRQSTLEIQAARQEDELRQRQLKEAINELKTRGGAATPELIGLLRKLAKDQDDIRAVVREITSKQ